jgi:transposase
MMNQLADTLFTAYVGIDWADAKHDICVRSPDGELVEFDCISSRPEAIADWALGLYQRFGGPIAVAVELTKGPIVTALTKYDFIVMFPVNPLMLARYREAFTPSRAKDDPTDAELAVDLITRHPQRFEPLQPQSVEMRKLMALVEHRYKVLCDQRRISNRLSHALKQYYPQVLEWFRQHNTVLFCDFVVQWPTLQQVKRARASRLERFFGAHNMRRKGVIERRLTAIKESTPLTEDTAVIDPYRLQVEVLIDQMRVTITALKRYDNDIDAITEQLPDYALLFSPLPGAGHILAPRLLAALGEDRERYQRADELQMHSGIAPVTERSGKKTWVRWRWQCPTFMRQTFVEWAAQTINKSAWAGAYYRQQRAKGASYEVAVRALAFKWIRILYRCWKDRKPYDELKYLETLRRKGSPLLKYLADPA